MSAATAESPRRGLPSPRSGLAKTIWQPSTLGIAAFVVVLLLVPSIGYEDKIPLLVAIGSVLIFAYAWNPVGGMLGEMSLAHVVFWAAGIYSVVLGLNAGHSFVVCVLIGVVIAMILSVLTVAFAIVARLDGLYLMVFTLVLVHFATAIVEDIAYFGKAEGVAVGGLPLTMDQLYYISAVYIGILILINLVLLGTRRGLAWLAIRDDAERVAALGWSTRKERLIAYVMTAALCAVGGALQGAAIGFASPALSLELLIIVVPLLAVYVGGPGTVWGPLLGVVLLETLSNVAGENAQSADAAEIARLLQYLVALGVVMFVMRRQRKRRQAAMIEGEAHALRRAGAAQGPDIPASPEAPKGLAQRVAGRARVRRSRAELSPSRRALAKPPAEQGPLRVEHLRKSFGGLRVLEDVTFHVEPGEILGLVGPNGAGKSTICNVIAGLYSPDGGTVTLGTRDVGAMAPHRRAQLGLGRTYQTPRVFPSLTLAENVAIAGSAAGTADARRYLEGFGVAAPDKLGETATLMERRMVEIARLAALRPQWVLLDEPLAGLAPDEHDLLLERVKDMAAGGASVLIIEHLVPVIAPITDRIVVLDGGRLIADGPPEVVLRQQEVVDAYLGEPIALELATT